MIHLLGNIPSGKIVRQFPITKLYITVCVCIYEKIKKKWFLKLKSVFLNMWQIYQIYDTSFSELYSVEWNCVFSPAWPELQWIIHSMCNWTLLQNKIAKVPNGQFASGWVHLKVVFPIVCSSPPWMPCSSLLEKNCLCASCLLSCPFLAGSSIVWLLAWAGSTSNWASN